MAVMVTTQGMVNMLAEMRATLGSEAQVLTRFVNVGLAVENLQKGQVSMIRIAIHA